MSTTHEQQEHEALIAASAAQEEADNKPARESAPSDDKNGHRLSVWHDLYVDILGSLVPGLLTVILGGATVALALSSVYTAMFGQALGTGDLLVQAKDVIGSVHWEIATVIVVSAYVIGAVFFRQDPKKPDAASALYVWMNSSQSDRSGLAVQAKQDPGNGFFVKARTKGETKGDPKDETKGCHKDKELGFWRQLVAIFFPNFFIDGRPRFKNLIGASLFPKFFEEKLGLDTQFPYLHMRCYLSSRGLPHLTHLVPWCPDQPETRKYRSKMFINILKVRLLALYPWMSRDIIRNEAHVRLATSVWYAVTRLFWLSVLVLAALLFSGMHLGRHPNGTSLLPSLFLPAAFAGLLLVFCAMMRSHLRKCIHYMRVREVIYVFETAHLAESIAGPSLFADLLKKEQPTECKNCKRLTECRTDKSNTAPKS